MPESGPSSPAPPSAADKGKGRSRSGSDAATTTLLQGEVIHLVKDQFQEDAIVELGQYAKDMGATTTSDPASATIILTNPCSPAWREEVPIARVAASGTSRQAVVRPYHWLASSRSAQALLDDAALAPARPIFTHPDGSRDHGPLRIWVSVNIHRNDGEDAHAAQRAVVDMLERGGALSVAKRAVADVLVVDRESLFYSTVVQEQRKHGRDWQKIVERDWVEHALSKGEMIWPSPPDEPESRHESMIEEAPARNPRAPGRPPGNPRVDYTAEDDEFLVRWLAYYHPYAAHGSRKTYQQLVDSAARYPLASRHTYQSWHERFKKNSALLSKRVSRLAEADLNARLQTGEERKKAEERKRQDEPLTPVEGTSGPATNVAAANAVGSQGEAETGQHAGTTAESEGGRLTRLAAQGTIPAPAASVEVLVQRPPSPEPTRQDPDERSTLAERRGSPKKLLRTRPPDDADGALASVETPAVATNGRSVQTGDLPQPDAGQTASHSSSTLPIADQRVDIAEDASARLATGGAAPADDSARVAIEQQALSSGVNESVGQGVLLEVEPESAPQGPPIETVQVGAEVTVIKASTVVAADGPGRQLRETPSTPTAQNGNANSTLATGTAQNQHLAEFVPFAARYSTPIAGSALKRSLVQNALSSSATKRQRALKRQVSGRAPSVTFSPDTVLATTEFPALREAPPPPPAGTVRAAVPPAPRLTPAEYQQAVWTGQEVVRAKREEYKAKISAFCSKYGLSAADLIDFVNGLPRETREGDYWGRIEVGLQSKYGF